MGRPLPIELRERIVAAYDNNEGSYRELAARFMVGEATVNRLLARHRRTGRLEPDAMGGARHEYVIDERGMALIKSLLEDDPTWTREELRAELKETYDIEASVATIGRARRRLGFTRKRGF